jgi:hypothetical protein
MPTYVLYVLAEKYCHLPWPPYYTPCRHQLSWPSDLPLPCPDVSGWSGHPKYMAVISTIFLVGR